MSPGVIDIGAMMIGAVVQPVADTVGALWKLGGPTEKQQNTHHNPADDKFIEVARHVLKVTNPLRGVDCHESMKHILVASFYTGSGDHPISAQRLEYYFDQLYPPTKTESKASFPTPFNTAIEKFKEALNKRGVSMNSDTMKYHAEFVAYMMDEGSKLLEVRRLVTIAAGFARTQIDSTAK